jgi:hypothetical protein
MLTAFCRLLAAIFLFWPSMMPQAKISRVRMNDSSDWWSILNEQAAQEFGDPQHREVSISNFVILGVALGEGQFEKGAAKLGKGAIAERGDAASGRSQACYVAGDSSRTVHLIFEQGEVDYSFYLFEGGAAWTGSDRCVKSNLIPPNIKTSGGLGLGQSASEVEAILGSPSRRQSDKLVYNLETKQPFSAEDLRKFRESFPSLSEKELRDRFDNLYVSVYIEARFVESKLNYLVVSKSEVD